MPVACKICSKIFCSQSSVNRHLKNVHNKQEKNIVSYENSRFNSKCLEEDCNTSYRFVAELRCHLETSHNIVMDKEIISFKTLEEFQDWFNNICKAKNLQYVRHEQKNQLSVYYTCNRSYKPRGHQLINTTRLRASKSQGSCKIGSKCTSQIILTVESNGQFCCTYHKTHYGHNMNIQHIRIPKADRMNIAAKLTSEISVTRVLDLYRSNFDESKLSRCDLINRKDINNIKSSFNINIQDGVRHQNDSVSVDLLVKQCEEVGDEILLYKQQGQDYPRLLPNDFCLIYMNKAQESILHKFASNILAIDSTHGLNMYDFELTTMMVIDEFGEGFPVCCMFSNRIDTIIHEIFFSCIKTRCGILHPNVFMSDITFVYYNAWVNSMGTEIVNRLYCSWHIDQAWRSNLNKISKADKRKEVYQTLKVLQNTLNVAEFEINITTFVKTLLEDPDTHIFGNYIVQNYTNNYKMWAYCFRKNLGINTNMVLESMHKTITYFYLEGKVVKRLDKGITAVLKYIRDKIVSRIIKITKGVNNSHIQDIHKRHRTAMISAFKVISIETSVWVLQSKNVDYLVSKRGNNSCTVLNCQLKCSFCNICIHEYECTCPDYYIRASICKHIHYINLNPGNVQTHSSLKDTSDTEIPNSCVTAEYLAILSQKSNSKEPSVVKEKINEEINRIKINMEMYNENDSLPVLPHILNTMKNANSLLSIKNRTSKTFSTSEHVSSGLGEPSNKKIVKQMSFFSTKKKPKKGTITNNITKPSKSKSVAISDSLNVTSEHDYY